LCRTNQFEYFSRTGGQFQTDKSEVVIIRRHGRTRSNGSRVELIPENPVFRGDSNPTSSLNAKGIPKSYLNEAGDLVPANPSGMYQGREVSAAEHILGGFRRGAKSNSPYTSFTPNGEIAAGYGGQKIAVDLAALRRAVQSGEVTGVEIIEQAQIQEMIRNNANLGDYWKNLASKWSARDQEVLIKGVVPKKFIKGE
jgi:toxin YqcG